MTYSKTKKSFRIFICIFVTSGVIVLAVRKGLGDKVVVGGSRIVYHQTAVA